MFAACPGALSVDGCLELEVECDESVFDSFDDALCALEFVACGGESVHDVSAFGLESWYPAPCVCSGPVGL